MHDDISILTQMIRRDHCHIDEGQEQRGRRALIFVIYTTSQAERGVNHPLLKGNSTGCVERHGLVVHMYNIRYSTEL